MVTHIYPCLIQTNIFIEQLLEFESTPSKCNVKKLIPLWADVQTEYKKLSVDNYFFGQIENLLICNTAGNFAISSLKKINEGKRIAIILHCLKKLSGFDINSWDSMKQDPASIQWDFYSDGMEQLFSNSEENFVKSKMDIPSLNID